MPGYGYSGKPTTTGWGPERIARAWVELMKRLGYTKFVAAGGDWGGVVTDLMGIQAPPELIGIHTNFPGIFPPEIDKALRIGGSLPPNLSAEEKAACVVIKEIRRQADGRIRDSVQRLRPQPHLESVGDSLLIDELQTLVSEFLIG